MTTYEAATLLSNHVSSSIVKRLPGVARKAAVLAVKDGADPVGVAECMREAVRTLPH